MEKEEDVKFNCVEDHGECYRVDGVMHIPKDPGNRHYQMIQRWIAQGNLPTQQEELPEPESTLPPLEEVKRQLDKLTQIVSEYTKLKGTENGKHMRAMGD